MNGVNADEALVKNLPAAAGALLLSTQSHWLLSWNNNNTLHTSHLITGGPAICRKTEREREKTEITLVLIQMWGSRFCSGSPKGHSQRLGLVVKKKKKKTCSRDLQASVGKHCVKTSKQVETSGLPHSDFLLFYPYITLSRGVTAPNLIFLSHNPHKKTLVN